MHESASKLHYTWVWFCNVSDYVMQRTLNFDNTNLNLNTNFTNGLQLIKQYFIPPLFVTIKTFR